MSMVPIPKNEAIRIYAVVGEALATWAQVETDLTILFYGLAGTKKRQQAAAIMDSIISLDTRLDVIDALFHLRSPNAKDAEFWRKLLERTRKLYKKRHKVAHFRLMAAESSKGVRAEIAPFFSYEAWMTGQTKTLNAGQIMELSASSSDFISPCYGSWIALPYEGGAKRISR